uniref:Uncharacterized protein n=1 Tax=Noctiluca scintillans TaxID=2966 RepID=A0A7S1A9R4_NOCSC|mmetsp:Transcript_37494/g.99662  ORF Transcript_37494/g.99662 Transcript_37494/m.99662 type:complete len:147 (+) Transcript_37494:741-1181(+)
MCELHRRRCGFQLRPQDLSCLVFGAATAMGFRRSCDLDFEERFQVSFRREAISSGHTLSVYKRGRSGSVTSATGSSDLDFPRCVVSFDGPRSLGECTRGKRCGPVTSARRRGAARKTRHWLSMELVVKEHANWVAPATCGDSVGPN